MNVLQSLAQFYSILKRKVATFEADGAARKLRGMVSHMLNSHFLYLFLPTLFKSFLLFLPHHVLVLIYFRIIERDLELSNRSLQEKVVFLSQLEQKLAETRTAHELEKETLLAQQKEEHSKHLAQVDERIRKILAAKDAELQTMKEALKSRERKLKASEEALAQINREIVSIKNR